MRAGIIEYRALLVRGVPFFFVGGRSDMIYPKADALSTRCQNFPTVERKVSSLGNFIFQGWKVFGNMLRRFVLSLFSAGRSH